MIILINAFLLNRLMFMALGNPVSIEQAKLIRTKAIVIGIINLMLFCVSIKIAFFPSFCLWAECLSSSLMWIEAIIVLWMLNERK